MHRIWMGMHTQLYFRDYIKMSLKQHKQEMTSLLKLLPTRFVHISLSSSPSHPHPATQRESLPYILS